MSNPVAANTRDTSRAVAKGLGIGGAVVTLLVGGWFGYSAWRDSRSSGDAQVAVQAPEASTEPVPESPHERARAQLAADRIAQPAGDNAAETYLAILATNPQDGAAREALIELLPLINDVANASADAGQVEELERLIGLIEGVDSSYAQLQRLRARAVEIRQAAEQAVVAAAQAEAAAVARQAAIQLPAPVQSSPAPVTASPAAPAPPRPSASTPAATSAATDTALTETSPAPTATTASIAPLPPRRAEIVEPVLVNRVDPRYPPQALARRLEGWVEVELTIGTDGSTTRVAVVGAQPDNPHFTREAVRAAERWRFQPKTIDGVPTEAKLRRRLNFRMPG